MQISRHQTQSNISLSEALWALLGKAFFTNSRDFWLFGVSIISLSFFQSCFILCFSILLKYMQVLGTDVSDLGLSSVLPKYVVAVFPSLENVTYAKQDLAFIIPLGTLLVVLGKSASSVFYSVSSAQITLQVSKKYRDLLFLRILEKTYVDIRKNSPGVWASRMMNDVNLLQNSLSDVLSSLLKDVILIFVSLLTIFAIHWQLALTVICTLPIMSFFVKKMGLRITRHVSQYQKEMSSLLDYVLHLRRRYDLCRVHSAVDSEMKSFLRVNRRYSTSLRKAIAIRSIFAPSLELFSVALIALLVVLVQNGWFQIEGSSHGLTSGVCLSLFRPIRSVSERLAVFHEVSGSLEKGLSIIGGHLRIDDRGSVSDGHSDRFRKLNEKIFISQMRVGYGKNIVATGHNLEITPGSMTALIGPSGCGKSTFVKTLCGLLEPLVYEGTPSYDLLVNQCGYAAQEPFLFDGSVKENILYGRSAQNSDIALRDAGRAAEDACLQLASVHGSLDLNHPVDSIRSDVSGGQRQRVALARILSRKKPILLLDEVTSALDFETEQAIVRRLRQIVLSEGWTILFVTHRKNLLCHFDQVWTFKGGVVRVENPEPDSELT